MAAQHGDGINDDKNIQKTSSRVMDEKGGLNVSD